jgi:hypothetical protein
MPALARDPIRWRLRSRLQRGSRRRQALRIRSGPISMPGHAMQIGSRAPPRSLLLIVTSVTGTCHPTSLYPGRDRCLAESLVPGAIGTVLGDLELDRSRPQPAANGRVQAHLPAREKQEVFPAGSRGETHASNGRPRKVTLGLREAGQRSAMDLGRPGERNCTPAS